MNKKWWHFFTLLLIQLAIMFCIHKKGVGYISAIVYNLFVLSYCFVFVRADYSSKLLTASKQITGRNIFYQVFRGIGYGFAFAILLFVILSFRYQIEVQKYSFLIILLQLVSQLIIASAEESFFRYYAFETLSLFKVPVYLSVIAISILFGIAHLITNQTLLKCIVASIFSVFLFYLRLSKKKESYLTLTLCHFTFNMFFTFIFLTVAK